MLDLICLGLALILVLFLIFGFITPKCPKCNSQFTIGVQLASGMKRRCGNCEHTWYQYRSRKPNKKKKEPSIIVREMDLEFLIKQTSLTYQKCEEALIRAGYNVEEALAILRIENNTW